MADESDSVVPVVRRMPSARVLASLMVLGQAAGFHLAYWISLSSSGSEAIFTGSRVVLGFIVLTSPVVGLVLLLAHGFVWLTGRPGVRWSVEVRAATASFAAVVTAAGGFVGLRWLGGALGWWEYADVGRVGVLGFCGAIVVGSALAVAGAVATYRGGRAATVRRRVFVVSGLPVAAVIGLWLLSL